MFSGFYVAVRYAVGMRGIKAAAIGDGHNSGRSADHTVSIGRVKRCVDHAHFDKELSVDLAVVWIGTMCGSVSRPQCRPRVASVLETPHCQGAATYQLSATTRVLRVSSASNLAHPPRPAAAIADTAQITTYLRNGIAHRQFLRTRSRNSIHRGRQFCLERFGRTEMEPYWSRPWRMDQSRLHKRPYHQYRSSHPGISSRRPHGSPF